MTNQRKKRFDLIEKNKTRVYFKYAIGEIALVVIGILLAIQINNWNEKRKHDSKINSLYSIIRSDLLFDIESIDYVINGMSPQDSIIQRIINKEMTSEDYKKCARCRQVLGGFPDISLKKRGLKLLEENSTIFGSNPDSLSIKINNFYSYHIVEIEVATEEISDDYNDNYYFFKNNKAWFIDNNNGVINDEFINYALTSSDYRNRIASFRMLYFGVYLWHLKEYKKDALIILDDIEKQII